MALTSEQFSLRTLLGFFLLVSLLLAIAVRTDRTTTVGLVVFAASARLIAIVVIGTVVEFLVRSIRTSTIAALIGVILADLIWLAVCAIFLSACMQKANYL